MSKNIESYTQEYMDDYGFEAEMVRYRRAFLMDRLVEHAPRTVVELGCGSDLQAAEYQARGGTWDHWVIIEPSETFAQAARDSGLPNLTVVQDFFENVSPPLIKAPDLMLCSGLLHEVPDADVMLSAMASWMGAGSRLHVNVPNARSFHRQLAMAMGLIDDLKTIGARNIALQQPRVYDLTDLVAQLQLYGLVVEKSGGYLVKPFTHQQMEPLVSQLGRPVLDGLFALGQSNPDMASEIYVEARLKDA